jgi:diguanylate cyclase (GGDEF)-like protein/PAS domain S-box-containing protein
MNLPLRARFVVCLAALGGVTATSYAAMAGFRHGVGPVLDGVVLTAVVLASWVWPLLIYRGEQSEAVHLDDGCFVIMALLLPPPATILSFAVATLVAQFVRRRPLVKSVFNYGQMLTAVSAGLAVVQFIEPPGHRLTALSLIAATAGCAVFFAVTTCFLAAILSATGAARFTRTLRDGADIRLLLAAACIGMAVMTALAVSTYHWAIVMAGIPFFILRQVLAGHFRARRDGARVEGLFKATLEANRTMGASDVISALERWSATLLRSSDARVTDERPGPDSVSTKLPTHRGERWLAVRGRSKAEPFDNADHKLLDALAAVGSGALSNAALYEEVERHRQRLVSITSTLGEGVCAVDTQGRLTFANPAAREMLGLLDGDVVGGEDDATPPDEHFDFLHAPAQRAISTHSSIRTDDTPFRHRDGTMFHVAFTCSPIVEAGTVTGAVIGFRDIAERKAFEERLAHRAFHDELTGLPNRRLFLDRLEQALVRSRRRSQTHAVLFTDVDRFKVVNDGIGHLAGDHLLVAITQRLRKAVRVEDTLARFGGDEFTILLEDIGDADMAIAAAQRVLACLEEPIRLPSGHEVMPTLSVGIALATGEATADDVLHDADVAMYRAKGRGPGRCELFDTAGMRARSMERVELEAALRHALERDEIVVHYQPIFDRSTKIAAAEALVRWQHPERGLVSPFEFIGIAEENGMIVDIGRRVLETACRDAKSWLTPDGEPVVVSVNLSARQFGQVDLVRQVADVLRTSGLPASQLCLEITESVAVHDIDRTVATLTELKGLGVLLAIDDFGTGYSSLNYLKRFPVDVVKLDRGFVAGMENSKVDEAIIAAVVGLAEAIGLTVVAEGVETESQRAALSKLGCNRIQGFLLARPVPLDEFETRFVPPAPAAGPPAVVLQLA